MTLQLTRRRLLLSAAAAGLAACGRRGRGPELNLWTLQLAPKVNRYFADLMADWATLHPGEPGRGTRDCDCVRPCTVIEYCKLQCRIMLM